VTGPLRQRAVMTKLLPFTEAAVRRAVSAARKAGLQVGAISIAPDGTVTVYQCEPLAPPVAPTQNAPPSKWAE
jgi:hypothetical protein